MNIVFGDNMSEWKHVKNNNKGGAQDRAWGTPRGSGTTEEQG